MGQVTPKKIFRKKKKNSSVGLARRIHTKTEDALKLKTCTKSGVSNSK